MLSDQADLESHTRISKTCGNIAALVRDVIEGFTARATGRDLDLAIAPDRLTATIDPSQVERAVAALLDNAVTYAPTGSRIEVEATATAEFVDIQVRDTGTGIPPADYRGWCSRSKEAITRCAGQQQGSRPGRGAHGRDRPRRRAAHEPTRTVRPVCHASTALPRHGDQHPRRTNAQSDHRYQDPKAGRIPCRKRRSKLALVCPGFLVALGWRAHRSAASRSDCLSEAADWS